MTRVFITGMGAITPIGNSVDEFWQNLKQGVSGAGRITRFDPSEFPSQIACEVKNFDPTDYMHKKDARRMALATQFCLAATRQALTHAQFEITRENAASVGIVMNTGGGGIPLMEDTTRTLDSKGPRGVGPFAVPSIMANAVSGVVSIEVGAMGPILTSTLACASGNYAFVEAYHLIQRGEADIIIAGGTESGISPVICAAFGRMQAMSTRNDDPARASRPFEANRDGFVSSEGGVAMILESEEHARARGATIYAEVVGGALTGDAYHVTAPREDGAGAILAMQRAVSFSGHKLADVDVIYAHGTSTPLNDSAESKAIKAVFGDYAYQIPVTGTKSMLGHALGAAGAFSALAAVMGFVDGIIPPTINYETPDPDCDLDYVPNEARDKQTNLALINAFGFGGQNVVLALKRYTA